MIQKFEEIFNNPDAEVPSMLVEDVEPLIIDDINNDESKESSDSSTGETSQPITSDSNTGGASVGYVAGSIAASAIGTFGMSAIGYWFLKRSIVKGVSSQTASVVANVMQANSGLVTNLAASGSKTGLFTKLIGSIKGGFSGLMGSGAPAGQLSLFNASGTAASGGGFFSTAGGFMQAAGAKITAVLTSTAFLVVAGVAIAVWGTFYLIGDLDMYEILELWSGGKHGDKATDRDYEEHVENTYKAAGSGLLSAKITGLTFLSRLNAKYQKEGKITIRLRDSEKVVEANAEEYLKLYEILDRELDDVPLITEIFAGKDEKEWVEKVKENYHGLNVSGRKNIDNYDILKAYVTKYMLEDEDDPKNPYMESVAEESEGWYSTFFENFIPGMSPLGWASWMLSEEYLNNMNSVTKLKSREWLYKAMNSYWIAKVENLDASSFTVEQFAQMSTHVLGNGILTKKLHVLNNLEYGIINDNAEYKRLGTFQELLRLTGKFNTEMLLNTAKSDKKVPVTNVTLSFALMHSTYSLLYVLYEGLVMQLALLQIASGIDQGERKVLDKYGVGDEYDSGKRLDNNSKLSKEERAKIESVKGGTSNNNPEKVNTQEIIKTADEVIETFKQLPNLQGFEG